MTATEVVLLIAGFIFVCISFFVSRRADEGSEGSGSTETVWTEQEEKMIRDRIDTVLKDYQINLIDDTENQMNRLCNDKIMAIDEFSQQVLSKMDANHQEVVFMYNMLNEKQKEIGNLVISSASEKIRDEIESDDSTEDREEIYEKPVNPAPKRRRKGNNNQNSGKNGRKKQQELSLEIKEPHQQREELHMEVIPAEKFDESVSLSEEMQAQIQKMYREGKSVLEISRELKVGQGEVKLLIALYGGRRR